MAQEKPVSPERQLLKLIEDSKEKKSANVQARVIKRNKLSLFSFGAWIGRISFFKSKASKWPGKVNSRQIDLGALNTLLTVSVLVLTVYFFWSFTRSMANLKNTPDLEIDTNKNLPDISTPAASALKDKVSYYLENVARRNIFEMYEKKTEVTTDIAQEAPTSELAVIMNSLKLVGISWSDEPYAMVEDGRSLKTFFVKKGQMIGKAQVKAIFKDKIILGYSGEEMELR